MSDKHAKPPVKTDPSYGSIFTYVSGYVLSLALTICAYWLVKLHISHHHLSPTDTFMVIGLSVLALTQLVAQLVFFLHLDRESKPRWNIVVLCFAVVFVVIVVAGSLWIMYHLNYNMSPKQQDNYLLHQDGGV